MSPPITSPDKVAIAVLNSLTAVTEIAGKRISTDVQPGGPAIRVALVGTVGAKDTWEWPARLQFDLFTDDEDSAADFAAVFMTAWPGVRGIFADAFVSTTTIEVGPIALIDASSRRARRMITGTLHAHRPGG